YKHEGGNQCLKTLTSTTKRQQASSCTMESSASRVDILGARVRTLTSVTEASSTTFRNWRSRDSPRRRSLRVLVSLQSKGRLLQYFEHSRQSPRTSRRRLQSSRLSV